MPKMPTFGVSIYSISRLIMAKTITPEDGVKWLVDQGAGAIELVPFGMDLNGDPALVTRLMKLHAPLTNYSLNANFLQISPGAYAAEVARVKEYIAICARMGISSLRVDCSSYRRTLDTCTMGAFLHELPLITRTYEDLCEYAARLSIKILLENHGFHVNGCDRVMAVMDSVKAENFGLQLDTGNFVCVDDKSEISTARCAHLATTVHLKDFYMRPAHRDPGDATQFDCNGAWFKSRAGQYLRGAIFGQGDLDVYQALNALKNAGFDGDIFIEFEGMEDCRYATTVSLNNAKRIWDMV